MQLRFREEHCNIKINNFDHERMQIKGHGSMIKYQINGKEETIGYSKDTDKVLRYADRIRRASMEADAKACYVDRHLERLEIIYEG